MAEAMAASEAASRQSTLDGARDCDHPKTRKSYTREYKLEVVRFFREHNLNTKHLRSEARQFLALSRFVSNNVVLSAEVTVEPLGVVLIISTYSC